MDSGAAFRAIKWALDPDGILNPSVLLPPEAGSAPTGMGATAAQRLRR